MIFSTFFFFAQMKVLIFFDDVFDSLNIALVKIKRFNYIIFESKCKLKNNFMMRTKFFFSITNFFNSNLKKNVVI